MEVKESGDTRCYMSDYGIPTIQLGCGGVFIARLEFESSSHAGVGFALSAKKPIGESTDHIGKDANDVGVFFQILSTKPESLQVLIDALIVAKKDLTDRESNEPTD